MPRALEFLNDDCHLEMYSLTTVCCAPFVRGPEGNGWLMGNSSCAPRRHHRTSKLPRKRMSSEEAPTRTSNLPGSTTQFMF